MDKDHLQELLEEHEPNLEVLEHHTDESVRNLYKALVKELVEALEGSE